MERRTFFTGTLGATTGFALPATGTAGAIGTAQLTELREGLSSLFILDDAYGAGDVRPLAARHLRRLRRLINSGSHSDSIGRQLHLLAGETAEHCAWLSFDAEDHDQARQYWGDALSVATMLRDDGLEVLVLAGLSLQAIHEGRAREGLDFARAARSRAEVLGSPTLVSLILAREARALAQMQDRTAASRTLAHSMRLAGHASGRPAPQWTAYFGPAELEFTQGLLNADAGHDKAAIPFLRASLASANRAAYGRNWTLYRLTLARTLARAGEAEEAAAEAVDTLDHLGEVQSGRVLRKLSQVRNEIVAVNTAAARNAVEAINDHVS